MIPRRRGKIVTVGSIMGVVAADKRPYEGLSLFRGGPPYAAAKGAIINLTRALAAEVAEHNIQVNCISPGHIPKALHGPDFRARMGGVTPLRRLGTPDDVKGAVALLSSAASDWITGHNLLVDGGWTIW
jgi:gluconate 5-dehydrogenase